MHRRVGFRILGALCAGSLLAGVGVGVSSGLVTTSSQPQPSPTAAVTPNSNLVDLQTVTVVGSHFSPSALLGTTECISNAVDANSCDLSTLDYAVSGPTGAFVSHRPVRRILDINGKPVDCAVPTACSLGIGNVDAFTESVAVPISFNPAVPPIVTRIRAVPAANLRDHQLVTVTGQGLTPGSQIDVTECLAAGSPDSFGCAYETDRLATVTNAGTISIPNFAIEREFLSFNQNGLQTVDCAATPHTCVLEALVNGFGKALDAPLSFDPTAPPAIPAISVSPSTRLGDLDLVTVHGFGFLPGSSVTVAQCSTANFACSPDALTVTAGFRGQFAVTLAVHRKLAGQGPVGVVSTDCANHGGACAIVSFAPGSLLAPNVSLSFDRSKPAIPTSVSVYPSSGLTDNQRVSITLKGFAPFRPIAVIECAATAVSEQNLGYCDPSAVAVTSRPAGGGHPTVLMFVHRQISGENGLVDCAASPGRCVLLAVPYQYVGVNGGGGSGGSVSVGGGLSVARAPRTNRLGYTAGGSSALPAPDNSGLAVRAAAGSNIPGVAVTPLIFSR
jgi:hypothetical protein